MSLIDFTRLFLACLIAGAILVSSSVALTTWRRGRQTRPLCARCLKSHEPVCETPADREFKARLLEALERNAALRSGSSWRSASTAAPPTAATTAASTTSGTGGSPGPDSAVVCSVFPTRRCVRPEGVLDCADYCERWGPEEELQHNPHSGRIDASSRKQFGMCDYPD